MTHIRGTKEFLHLPLLQDPGPYTLSPMSRFRAFWVFPFPLPLVYRGLWHDVTVHFPDYPIRHMLRRRHNPLTGEVEAAAADERSLEEVNRLYEAEPYDFVCGESAEVLALQMYRLERGKMPFKALVLEVDLLRDARHIAGTFEKRLGGDIFHRLLEMPEMCFSYSVERYGSWYRDEGIAEDRLFHIPSTIMDYGFIEPRLIDHPEKLLDVGKSRLREPILAAGTGARDWKTVVEAARGLEEPIHVIGDRKEYAGPLPSTIRWHGFRPLIPFLRDLREAKIVVIPVPFTRRSAGQLTAGTALSFGKPVVGADIPALEGFVIPGETGLSYPPGDADALREAIRELLHHPERRQYMGKRGKEIEGALRRKAQANLDVLLHRLIGR